MAVAAHCSCVDGAVGAAAEVGGSSSAALCVYYKEHWV